MTEPTQHADYERDLFLADITLVATWARKNSVNHLVRESAERLLRESEFHRALRHFDGGAAR
jgi:hypothetical protein